MSASVVSDMARVVFLNALPLNAIQYEKFTIWCSKWTFELMISEFKEIYKNKYEVLCFIRHPATIKVLNEILKEVNITLTPSSELYIHKDFDIIYIVTLKKVERGKEVTELSKDDLEIYQITVMRGLW